MTKETKKFLSHHKKSIRIIVGCSLKCPVVVCFERPKFTGSLSSILPENMLALFTKLCDSYKPLILDNSINGYSK